MMGRKLITALCALLLASPAVAQEPPSGIRLGGPYNVNRPLLAVRPFGGDAGLREAIDSVTRIVQRDLTHNKRFRVLEPVPQSLEAGDVDYRAWNALNVVYLVAADVTPSARGYELSIVVHDVVYGRPLNQQRFAIPASSDPDFRMAVHAISDEVVRWITQTPGIAATRIAYTRQNGGLSYDLMLMDSDGFDMRRIAGFGGQLYSPTWSPDGRRILYAVNNEQRGWELIERDVTSGSQRNIRPGGQLLSTPVYARDGRKIALSIWRNDGMEVIEYDIQQQCCAKQLVDRRGDNLSPVFSPDGQRLGFVSTALGRAGIYVMPATGGDPVLLTPFVRGQASEYQAPSWSPTGSKITFHGHWNMRAGNYQIMVADADRPGNQIEQITGRGNNEDPSWAPDGRHIIYTSVGDGPSGLYVIDAETKERRPLAPGGNLRMAEWSPRLVRAADLVVRSGNPNEEN